MDFNSIPIVDTDPDTIFVTARQEVRRWMFRISTRDLTQAYGQQANNSLGWAKWADMHRPEIAAVCLAAKARTHADNDLLSIRVTIEDFPDRPNVAA